jgi:hypothetical protein
MTICTTNSKFFIFSMQETAARLNALQRNGLLLKPLLLNNDDQQAAVRTVAITGSILGILHGIRWQVIS